MSAIGTLSPGNAGLSPLIDNSKVAVVDDADMTQAPFENPAMVEGVKVTLSGAGIDKATGGKDENSDIEESGLPENIQQILKMIRRLQQIAEKMADMQAVMKDKRLSLEEIKARLGTLQAFITNLNGGMIVANTALSKAMKQAGLGPDQILKAASLLLKS
ncbi:hypothetical protein POF45_25825 [Pseudomonas sp. 681]|uniref:Uncharacterized protein n=2 Tax=Pseudomonas TaxID=286 RepID=A0ABT6QV81_9PSED|nr:hypothetical protein [Pseudomonas sp. 681]MDI2594822.1 hypothetical protein [Pseudomonas sp. 681]